MVEMILGCGVGCVAALFGVGIVHRDRRMVRPVCLLMAGGGTISLLPLASYLALL